MIGATTTYGLLKLLLKLRTVWFHTLEDVMALNVISISHTSIFFALNSELLKLSRVTCKIVLLCRNTSDIITKL